MSVSLGSDPQKESILFDALILIEPALISRNAEVIQKEFVARSISTIQAQLDVWPTIEDSTNWHKARLPWKGWHPDVLEVFWVSCHYLISGLLFLDT
jgi:hypothetical protein